MNHMLMKTYVVLSFQAYYRQGIALQCLGQHAEGLAAFAAGLAQDPKNTQLLTGLVESAIKSPLKGKTYQIVYLYRPLKMRTM